MAKAVDMAYTPRGGSGTDRERQRRARVPSRVQLRRLPCGFPGATVSAQGSGPLNWAVSSRQGNGVSKLPTQSQGAPIAATPPRPPAPRLQTSPTRDLQEMRRAENARLQSYGWVDRTAGIVRLPIERAMEMVVEQGLPSWHEVPEERR